MNKNEWEDQRFSFPKWGDKSGQCVYEIVQAMEWGVYVMYNCISIDVNQYVHTKLCVNLLSKQ